MKSEVIKILETADFQLLGNNISIEDVVINFDAVLVGPHSANDLVLIQDINQLESDDYKLIYDLIKRIDLLSLLLARTNSTRIINLIIIGEQLKEEHSRDLEGYCRLIQIPTTSEEVEKFMYSLLPLNLPAPIKFDNSALTSLEGNLDNLSSNSTIQELIRAARFSSEDVEEIALLSLNNIFEQAFK